MTENRVPDFPATDWRPLIDALATERLAVAPQALPAAVWQALHGEAAALMQAQSFAPARIGRGAGSLRETTVRGDERCWLEPAMPAGSAYLAWMDTLRQALNRELFLGLREFEAHYAHYPPGAFYKRHVDRHRDSNARVVSSVFYLNAGWPGDAGGELVVYGEDDAVRRRVPPQGGTLVLFMSEDVPHEVLPATQERWSIAGWFRG